MIDGRVVFSEEVAWDPSHQPDPAWHLWTRSWIRCAPAPAAHLPRVDAIGGSAAGVYVAGEVRVASLFRAVPRDLFVPAGCEALFGELRRAWGDIPFAVLNDGEVTALAGAMLFGVGSLLGVAMGSSQAGGYVTADGRLTDWLNELAFIPLDLAPAAPVDEWSVETAAVVRSISLSRPWPASWSRRTTRDRSRRQPAAAPHPGVQELMEAGDRRALAHLRDDRQLPGVRAPRLRRGVRDRERPAPRPGADRKRGRGHPRPRGLGPEGGGAQDRRTHHLPFRLGA